MPDMSGVKNQMIWETGEYLLPNSSYPVAGGKIVNF